MQAVKELPLEGPLELGVIQVARVKLEVVGMHGYVGILELDNDLHALPFPASVEGEQGVFVQAELGKDPIKTRIGGAGHHEDCKVGCRGGVIYRNHPLR